MRVILTNFGTIGDLQPFLSLAVELRRHGHEPILAFSPYFETHITSLGLPFIPLGPDFQRLQQDINAAMMVLPDSGEQMSALLAPLVSVLPDVFWELWEACRGADVLISGPAQPASRMVHETMGIPFASVQVSHFGGLGTPALQQASAALINPVRAQFGLPPLRDPLTRDANSPQLALYAMSRHVRPPQADWPPHYHMIGFFFMPAETWQPDPALVEFIAQGEPPVVISFGSMSHADPAALTDLLLDAIQRAGCRAIIQHGWSGLAHASLPAHIRAVGFVPHAWLFSQAACIVHHGGSGTAAAVFRSGVPSLFVPHGTIFDQHYWGELACELGCAGPVIPYPQLSAERLANAIITVRSVPSYRQAAAALGEKVRAEPGVRQARQLIEQLVYRIGLHDTNAATQRDAGRLEGRAEWTYRRKQYQQSQRARRKAQP